MLKRQGQETCKTSKWNTVVCDAGKSLLENNCNQQYTKNVEKCAQVCTSIGYRALVHYPSLSFQYEIGQRIEAVFLRKSVEQYALYHSTFNRLASDLLMIIQ